MKTRLVLVLLCVVTVVLVIAPGAIAITVRVDSIDPGSGVLGQTVTATVSGLFDTGLGAEAPSFSLDSGSYHITAVTTSWDSLAGGWADIKFTIPASAPSGVYDLGMSQYYGFVIPKPYHYTSKAGAFVVIVPPHIDTCEPSFILAGSGDQLMFVRGSGFTGDLFWPTTYLGSRVYWNGTMLTSTWSSASLLNATVPASLLTTPGYAIVTVSNLSDSTTSNEYTVTVTIPTPTISYTEPTSAVAGSGDFEMNVVGSNYVPGAVVMFNGTDLVTNRLDATKLHALVPASLVASAGTYNIVVRNGGAGAPVSAAHPFTVTAPVPGTPIISNVSPSSIAAGGAAQPMIVSGSGFVSGAVVYWNSTPLSTVYGSATQLTATVPASLLATAGTVNIIVHNGSGASAPVSAPWAYTVTSVTPGTPAITSISPTSATAAGAAFPLTVNGSGFIASSVVVWANGGTSTDLVTTFVSATQLTAPVPATLIATAGTASITVRNGAAGSLVSAAVSFAISGGGGGTFGLVSLDPAQVWAGYVGPGVTLAVNGTGFVSGAHIWLGTQEKTATTFVSATRLTCTLLPADLASTGTIQVSVKNPPAVASPSTLTLAVSTETTDPTVTIGGADSGWHNSPVALTFTGADSQSGVQKVQYRCPAAVGSWTNGTTYTVPTTTQGEITVSAQVFDWCDRVGTASATVKIDTTKPKTDALNAVSVNRRAIAKLKFRVSEPSDLSPRADVTIQIRKGKRVVKTKTLSGVPMNTTELYSFKVNLKSGSYKWYVYAKDLAGNPQVKADWASFKVR
jgi:hypothetical protein